MQREVARRNRDGGIVRFRYKTIPQSKIKEDVIYVVDYYWGIKKEKHISRSDITSAEICIGYSCKVKGYRFSFGGMRYIVFRNNKKYLFKIIYLPETEEIFKQYLQ